MQLKKFLFIAFTLMSIESLIGCGKAADDSLLKVGNANDKVKSGGGSSKPTAAPPRINEAIVKAGMWVEYKAIRSQGGTPVQCMRFTITGFNGTNTLAEFVPNPNCEEKLAKQKFWTLTLDLRSGVIKSMQLNEGSVVTPLEKVPNLRTWIYAESGDRNWKRGTMMNSKKQPVPVFNLSGSTSFMFNDPTSFFHAWAYQWRYQDETVIATYEMEKTFYPEK